MDRPKITKEEALRLLSFPVTAKVFLIAFRGYYKDSMGEKGKNDRSIYDDAMVLIAPDVYKTFNANTDPSKYKRGIATLIPGIHLFKKGKHGITRPGGGYPAFRPATSDESLPVTRDGQEGEFKGIAINIHRGGVKTTGSEGCQTLPPDQWAEFQPLVYSLLDKYGQKLLPYILVSL